MRPRAWPGRVLHLALLAAMLTLAGLALLWLLRNPLLTSWDEVMHQNNSMMDALLLRDGNLAALRDAIFLQNRWLPPGLRLVGLPIAAIFWSDAPTALRLAATVLTLAPLPIIWFGLRPVAGAAGATAGALLFALTPQNMVGAQSFMTETVLHLAAACAMTLLLREALAPRPGPLRLAVLGPVLGLGALSKLTFLPTIGIVWIGLALWRLWRDRDAAAFALRLALPAVGLALVAWPHYLLNIPRYIAYAKATAGGYAYNPVESTGLDFARFAAGDLLWEVFGLGGTALLLAGLVAAVPAWRRLAANGRAFVLLAALAAAPPFLAFLLSHNQTERYMAISLVILAYPLGLLVGTALRDARTPLPRLAAGGAGAAALVQFAAAWWVALAGPVEARPLRPMVEAAWRPNFACDFQALTALVPPGRGAPRLGLFGLTLAVNPPNLQQAFLRQGIQARAIEIMNDSALAVDWERVLRETRQVDLVLVPEVFWQGGRDPLKTATARNVADRSLAEFRARLAAEDLVEDRGAIRTGPDDYCTVHALAVKPPPVAPADVERLRPLRPEVHALTGGS
ncbi:MAG: glycosyltransferase family 39 protein [Paracraurococcus sp.]